MGQVISIVSGIVDGIRKIRQWVVEDKVSAERKRLDDLKDPITPPQFYNSLKDRAKNVVSTNSYSVEKIREALNNDVVPAGYSLEQLEATGFNEEVDALRKRRNESVIKERKNLKDAFNQVMMNLEAGFPDLTQEDRNALQKAGLLNEQNNKRLVDKIKGWMDGIDKGEVDVSMIDEILSIAQARTAVVNDALDRAQLNVELQSKIKDAQGKRDASILEILNRSLRF